MNIKEFAELLNGREQGNEITPEEERTAKENGLVVCFCASDDLLEIRGAIDEELEAGGEEFVLCKTPIGSIKWGEETNVPCEEFGCDRWAINAIWCPKEDNKTIASWLISSDIPHEQFKIYEDGELYCIGVVFHIDELR